MENKNKKCSFSEHKEIDSKFYCKDCKVYMCNKCINFHSKFLEKHTLINLEKEINEIFTGICPEENHNDVLEYFCKSHNKLCCAACIAKIKRNQNGLHKDCDVCQIEDIKEEKKNKIKEKIKYLEDLSNNLEKLIISLKTILEKIKKNKEEIKIQIQNVFTKVRNELNNREDELLLKVEKEFEDRFFNENIIKECEKLPNKIKLSLEKVDLMNKENDDNKNLNLFINNCINIENNIKEINTIKEKVEKCKDLENVEIIFVEKNDKKMKEMEILDYIKNFGNLEVNDDFKEIQNPWTNQKFYTNNFYYTLKENSYIAEKTEKNDFIHLIKSSYQFKKDKIYKLEFTTNYISGDFQIGFADYIESKNKDWFYSKFNSVGLTDGGLYINGSIINKDLYIKNGLKIEFIINIPKKSFILNIDGKKEGEFNFNFQDNIFAHAAIRNIGNSVTIKTFEK